MTSERGAVGPSHNKPRGHAIITGAGGGIGRALVSRFAAEGYRVIAIDRIERPSDFDSVEYLQADLQALVADPGYAETLIGEISRSSSDAGLDVLINNAAIQILGGVETLSLEDWRRTLDVNLLAPFRLTQGLLRDLERTSGCVVNISSIHARLTKADFVAYATSKAALSGMTRALAVDVGGRIRVNAIEPAAIATEMLKAGFEASPERYALLEACHPQGRIGTPEEVAALALALVSGELRFLHGACIGMDGGIGNRLFDPA